MRLGGDGPVPVVLDEFGYLMEADPSLPSQIASTLGPAGRGRGAGRARLVLCGSAIAMMRSLTAGGEALRGRAGLELVMLPDDYRVAASRLPDSADLRVAARVFSVIGGVVGYATDMIDSDLPDGVDDVDRWIVQRVLSPAATLHHEGQLQRPADQHGEWPRRASIDIGSSTCVVPQLRQIDRRGRTRWR